tara:strand:+ start:1251 stop:1895 length:645 start_codon:yes stop_codon:yes gene_type:complete
MLHFQDVGGKNMKQIDIEVVDNFLSPRYFNRIKNTVLSNKHPWYSLQAITGAYDESTDSMVSGDLQSYGFYFFVVEEENVQFEHPLSYMLTGFLHQAQDYCGRENIVRSRFDMVTRSSETKYQHDAHVDISPYRPNIITAIFYLTDSDAETVIFNEKQKPSDGEKSVWNSSELTVKERIMPKENRILFFDGHYIHTGYSPVNFKHRILLNSNFA